MYCKNCGSEINGNAGFCQMCGAPTAETPKNKSLWKLLIPAIAALLSLAVGLGIGFAVWHNNDGNTEENKEKITVSNSDGENDNTDFAGKTPESEWYISKIINPLEFFGRTGTVYAPPEYYYNEDGKLIKIIDGETETFNYDKYGRLVSLFGADLNYTENNGQYVGESGNIRLTYNKSGTLVLFEKFFNDGSKYSRIYNDKGILIKELFPVTNIIREYSYDGKGNLIRMEVYRDGKSVGYMEWVYEYENDKPIKADVVYYDDENSDRKIIIYQYDGNGNLSSETYYDDNGYEADKTTYEWSRKTK